MSTPREYLDSSAELSEDEHELVNVNCADETHHWPEDAQDGDTCNCGEWYRFNDRIEQSHV